MRRAPLAVAAIAAALTGCGDESEKSTGSVTVSAGQPVAVKGDEYSFRPGTITVRSGGRPRVPVRFEFHNVGSLPHDIHVRRDGDDLGGTEAVGDGKTASATVELDAGDYEIFCSIGDHADLGMTGDLKIE